MSEQTTRKVKVLTTFTDRENVEHPKDQVFVASYANARQRQVVNEMIHRGFLIFAEEPEPAKAPEPEATSRRGGRRT